MIPALNHSGVLPPFTAQPHDFNGRSPYPTNLAELAGRFAVSPERREIVRGLAKYRQELRQLGVTGFQWIDGSFIEDVEQAKGRPPSDVDVVTFGTRPNGLNDQEWYDTVLARPDLFDPEQSKKVYFCDAYFVDLTRPPTWVVALTSYWYGLFSHQRDTFLWKGLVQLDLLEDSALNAQLLGGDDD